MLNFELMKCVVDTSPIVWLNKIGQFELLKDVYSTLYTTPGVKKQLDKTTVPVAFIDELVVPSDIKNYEHYCFRVTKDNGNTIFLKPPPIFWCVLSYKKE